MLASCIAVAYVAVAARFLWLGVSSPPELRVTNAETLTQSYSRPDIVDRAGRLIATDMLSYSLFADPSLIADPDEIAEKLVAIFPDLEPVELRRLFADKGRRFQWLKRGLTPRLAQRVHELGEPGLGFRREPKRVYPLGRLAAHVVGTVNVDNRGQAGVERGIDELGLSELRHSTSPLKGADVQLSIDAGVQHVLERELADAAQRYGAKAVSGLVLDVDTGELLAAASLPAPDPGAPADWLETATKDRVAASVFELGSIAKAFTVAMALEGAPGSLHRRYDVRQPLAAGSHVIKDLHPAGRPLSLAEIFTLSSNVGAGMIAREAGGERQRAFLEKLGLLAPLRTEAGPVSPPLLPLRWGDAETVTIAYGHGLAISPLQFASAAAALVNGGMRVPPTVLRRTPEKAAAISERVLSAESSLRMRSFFRQNVMAANGTGRRIEPIAGPFRVGGKTGTADLPGVGGYRQGAVIASFLGAFPMEKPRYLTLVSLFEPRANGESRGQNTAGFNAAPATGRLVLRIAPLLGVMPTMGPVATSAGGRNASH